MNRTKLATIAVVAISCLPVVALAWHITWGPDRTVNQFSACAVGEVAVNTWTTFSGISGIPDRVVKTCRGFSAVPALTWGTGRTVDQFSACAQGEVMVNAWLTFSRTGYPDRVVKSCRPVSGGLIWGADRTVNQFSACAVGEVEVNAWLTYSGGPYPDRVTKTCRAVSITEPRTEQLQNPGHSN